jgi:hypothetical protein
MRFNRRLSDGGILRLNAALFFVVSARVRLSREPPRSPERSSAEMLDLMRLYKAVSRSASARRPRPDGSRSDESADRSASGTNHRNSVPTSGSVCVGTATTAAALACPADSRDSGCASRPRKAATASRWRRCCRQVSAQPTPPAQSGSYACCRCRRRACLRMNTLPTATRAVATTYAAVTGSVVPPLSAPLRPHTKARNR